MERIILTIRIFFWLSTLIALGQTEDGFEGELAKKFERKGTWHAEKGESDSALLNFKKAAEMNLISKRYGLFECNTCSKPYLD